LAMWGLFLTTLALGLVLLALGVQVKTDNATPPKALLETGQAAKINAPPATGEVTLVSYNIRWRTGAELDQIAAWLKSQNATIIALQEVDRGKKRTGKNNNARALADAGASVLLLERDLTPETFAKTVALAADGRRLAELGEAARKRGNPNAARTIVEKILELSQVE